jgi:hypothetical protein
MIGMPGILNSYPIAPNNIRFRKSIRNAIPGHRVLLGIKLGARPATGQGSGIHYLPFEAAGIHPRRVG